jgi:hypothetical protein
MVGVAEPRPPVRCPRCNNQPAWREEPNPQRLNDTPGLLGEHSVIGWRCNNCQFFLPVAQWQS